MADEAIEIKFQMTAEDHAQFSAGTSLPFILKPSKLRLAFPVVVATLFGLVMFWGFWYSTALLLGKDDFEDVLFDLSIFTTFEFLASYGIVLVCVVAIMETLYENSYKESKTIALRMIASGPNKAILAPMHATLSKEGIKVHSNFVNYAFQWNGVEKVEIQNGDFCIFYSSISALCIPSRFFASEQEKQAIYQKCQTWFLDANKNAV